MKLHTQDESDKTKDIFVGTWRPPYPEILERFKNVTVGLFPGSALLREQYLRGDFDEPLYRRLV